MLILSAIAVITFLGLSCLALSMSFIICAKLCSGTVWIVCDVRLGGRCGGVTSGGKVVHFHRNDSNRNEVNLPVRKKTTNFTKCTLMLAIAAAYFFTFKKYVTTLSTTYVQRYCIKLPRNVKNDILCLHRAPSLSVCRWSESHAWLHFVHNMFYFVSYTKIRRYENRRVSYLMSEIENRHAKWMKCMEARKHTFEKWYSRNEPKISCHSIWFWYVLATGGFGNEVKWFEWKCCGSRISQSSSPIWNLDMNSRWRAKSRPKSYHNKKRNRNSVFLSVNATPKYCSSSSAMNKWIIGPFEFFIIDKTSLLSARWCEMANFGSYRLLWAVSGHRGSKP